MDFYERAKELKNMLRELATMRDDELLKDYVELVDPAEMEEFSLFVYIGALTQYFSSLQLFSEEEIDALGLYNPLFNNGGWRRIKYNWAD